MRKPGCLHAPSGSVHFTNIAHLNAWWKRTGQVKVANEAAKAKQIRTQVNHRIT